MCFSCYIFSFMYGFQRSHKSAKCLVKFPNLLTYTTSLGPLLSFQSQRLVTVNFSFQYYSIKKDNAYPWDTKCPKETKKKENTSETAAQPVPFHGDSLLEYLSPPGGMRIYFFLLLFWTSTSWLELIFKAVLYQLCQEASRRMSSILFFSQEKDQARVK